MKKSRISNPGDYTDVRYSKSYSISFIVLAIWLIIASLTQYDTSLAYKDNILHIVMCFFGIVFLAIGIDTLAGKKYFRLDKQNKLFIIYGGIPFINFISRKKSFDKIFADEKDIYLENNGRKKILNIFPSICNKADYKTFKQDITSN